MKDQGDRNSAAEKLLEAGDLTGAQLAGAKVNDAALAGLLFDGADLSESNLYHADLRAARGRGARIVNAKWRKADLTGIDLAGSNLSGTWLDDSCLDDAKLQGVLLIGSRLVNGSARRADFSHADLNDAILTEARLEGASFGEAELDRACLSGAHLEGARLRHTSLAGADLSSARLDGADLTGADLSGAVLEDANLCGADLTGADLSGARLGGLVFDRKMRCLGARVSNSFGNPLFVRTVLDLSYVQGLLERTAPLAPLHPRRVGLFLWRLTSAYGQSPLRLLASSAVVALLFATAFAVRPGLVAWGPPFEELPHSPLLARLPGALFESALTLGGLGLGHAVPATPLGALVIGLESLLGVLAFAALLAVLLTRFARRAG